MTEPNLYEIPRLNEEELEEPLIADLNNNELLETEKLGFLLANNLGYEVELDKG